MTILVTGGAGFIGSHTVLMLREMGVNTVVLDDLSNGHRDAVWDAPFIEGSVHDQTVLNSIFSAHDITAVIHFAAFIEAGESVKDPLRFYENNVGGTISLLQAMVKHGVSRLVFSSTAAVYGEENTHAPLVEDGPTKPINPYGETKLAAESIIADTCKAHGLRAVALRYFNAAGSDPEGRLGERHDPETHLIPLVLQCAAGVRPDIKIFGDDYDTPDGTCVRDYIHVNDLADAHIKALAYLEKQPQSHFEAMNLGSGKGYSVHEVVESARRITGKSINAVRAERRPGDPAMLVASAARAESRLGWKLQYPALDTIVSHAWGFLRGLKS